MSLRTRFIVILTAVLSIFASCLSVAQAGWVKVQDNPITIYRDTRTGLEWSVTISEAGNSNAKAQRIVQQYGLRLPTWNELRDVVNNNDAIDWLEIEDGLLDLYETSNPNVLAGAFGGSISTPRPRQALTRTWAIGVRGGSGSGNTPRPPQPPANPNQGGGFTPGEIINPEYGDRIVNINGIAIRDEAHFREIIRNANTRIVFTLIDQRTGNAYKFTTVLWPKGSTTRLGIYVQDDSRGGVMVTGIMDGTPGTNCRYVGIGNGNLPQPTPSQNPTNVGKLYVLNVWGTNATDLKKYYEDQMEMFEIYMDCAGLTTSGRTDADERGNYIDPVTHKSIAEIQFCKEFTTLHGNSASNENVLNKCREIGQKAQKNDVIFVYIACHGITSNIKGDNNRYHVLFPGITKPKDAKKPQNGITRSDIIQALNPDGHRLTVLITDTCTNRVDQEVEIKDFHAPRAERNLYISNLWLLLRTNTGFINWSSTSPFGGNDGEGEKSVYYQLRNQDGHEMGPNGVFSDAFHLYAFEETKNDKISTNKFFTDLNTELDKQFQEAKSNPELKTYDVFKEQDTQTLFDFKGFGYVTD